MKTIGFIGIGKIGLPICANLISSGFSVLGYRRSSLDEFVKLGGVPAASPADVAARSDLVLMCLPTDQALDDVINGKDGILGALRKGQIVVELGSRSLSVKQKYVAPLAAKGAIFLDGEVSGTPGMVIARKGSVYLAGDQDAIAKTEPVIAGFADVCLNLGAFGNATKVKLINNLLVAAHIASAAQAMAIAHKAGADMPMLIKAVSTGSGASMMFNLRAPWMAERKFMPQQGPARGLLEYLVKLKSLAGEIGAETHMLDYLIDVYTKAAPDIGERDVAAILEFFESSHTL